MIRRMLDAIRRWWYSGSGQHERVWGDDDAEFFDVTRATIPRKPVLGHPPWQTAPMPAICLFPQTAAPAPYELAPGPALHPIVRAQLGADSVAEFIERLFSAPLPAAA